MSLRRFFRRRSEDADLQLEMASFIDEEISENIARGVPPDEARRRAVIKLGNSQRVRENLWHANTVVFADKVWRDVKYASRTLLRSPAFTLVAVAVIALCIGAATSLFTIVRSVLLRPLPFSDPDRLIMVYEHFRSAASNSGSFNYNVVSPADFYDWRSQTHGFADMAVWRWWQFNLTGERSELPEVVQAAAGSWNLFPLLGVQPVYGRTFTQTEDQPGGDAVLLTWSLFQRRFGGDPSIVGRQIHLDDKPRTVVGILPAAFTYPDAKVQVWVPYQAVSNPAELGYHDHHQSRVIARLRPDVSLDDAISQVEAVQYRLHMQYLNNPVAEDVAPRTLTDDLARDVRKPLTILMCAVGCMLLIGCLNVANLLVARGAARQKEAAIRSALGAQRLTLIREQMTESFLICVAGGAAGIAFSLVATRWVVSSWKDLPSTQNIHVDAAVLSFACALVFASAIAAGLLPAISTTSRAVFATLQASSRSFGGSVSRTALRKTLLTIEIAVTVVLLIAAGLLLKSFLRLRSTDIGCATDHVLTLGYSLPEQKYGKPGLANNFNATLLERLRALPGVRGVALGSVLPGAGSGGDDVFTIPEHPPIKPGSDLPDAIYRRADPGYFSALQIPLLRGRFFTSQDRDEREKKVIVSRQLANQYFPGEDPVGKHLRVPAYRSDDLEIVGVVADTRWRVDQPIKPMMYFPVFAAGIDDGFMLAIHTAADPLAISIPVQKELAALDPDIPVTDVLTLDQVVGESLGNASFSSTLVLAFAALSLLLASVGLYGVLSYMATQRMTEIGIRIAMGARREAVLRMMLADGLRPAIIGLIFGLAAAAATVRVVQSMLYGATPLDPVVYAGVTLTLLSVAAMACMVPAWRASRLDPAKALRSE